MPHVVGPATFLCAPAMSSDRPQCMCTANGKKTNCTRLANSTSCNVIDQANLMCAWALPQPRKRMKTIQTHITPARLNSCVSHPFVPSLAFKVVKICTPKLTAQHMHILMFAPFLYFFRPVGSTNFMCSCLIRICASITEI